MTLIEWIVIIIGISTIAWINWYFFVAQRTALDTSEASGPKVRITVDGEYIPAIVRIKKDAPVQLIFDRRDGSSCSEEVVLPDFGVRKSLPPYEKTAIDLRPSQAGVFNFRCGMSVLHGRVVVEE
jgi:plastocyanin domain-containing protein